MYKVRRWVLSLHVSDENEFNFANLYYSWRICCENTSSDVQCTKRRRLTSVSAKKTLLSRGHHIYIMKALPLPHLPAFICFYSSFIWTRAFVYHFERKVTSPSSLRQIPDQTAYLKNAKDYLSPDNLKLRSFVTDVVDNWVHHIRSVSFFLTG